MGEVNFSHEIICIKATGAVRIEGLAFGIERKKKKRRDWSLESGVDQEKKTRTSWVDQNGEGMTIRRCSTPGHIFSDVLW